MESIISYSIAAIVALAFGYFIYTRVTSKKNQSSGTGGGGGSPKPPIDKK